MNDQELVKWARSCVDVEGDCRGCPFDRPLGAEGFCSANVISALAERVEKLGEHCARYAEEIAVRQERERWISVEEKLPEEFVSVLGYSPDEAPLPTVHECYIDQIGGWHRASVFTVGRVTHWMPLPEPPKEGE